MFQRKKQKAAVRIAEPEEENSEYKKAGEEVQHCLSALDRQIEEKRGVTRMAKRVTQTVRDLDLAFRIPHPKKA